MHPASKPFEVVLTEPLCHQCGACVGICPFGALLLTGSRLVVQNENCRTCRWCLKICPFHALSERPLLQAAR